MHIVRSIYIGTDKMSYEPFIGINKSNNNKHTEIQKDEKIKYMNDTLKVFSTKSMTIASAG